MSSGYKSFSFILATSVQKFWTFLSTYGYKLDVNTVSCVRYLIYLIGFNAVLFDLNKKHQSLYQHVIKVTPVG